MQKFQLLYAKNFIFYMRNKQEKKEKNIYLVIIKHCFFQCGRVQNWLEVAVSLQKCRQQLLEPIVSGCKKSKTTLLIEKTIYEARLLSHNSMITVLFIYECIWLTPSTAFLRMNVNVYVMFERTQQTWKMRIFWPFCDFAHSKTKMFVMSWQLQTIFFIKGDK